MLQLFNAAERLSARVLLVGDRRQHRSVTAGEPLRLLEQSAGLRVAGLRRYFASKETTRKSLSA